MDFLNQSKVLKDMCCKMSWMRGSPHKPRTTPQNSAQPPREVRTTPPAQPLRTTPAQPFAVQFFP